MSTSDTGERLALGLVVPAFEALLHGEPLDVHAFRALERAGVPTAPEEWSVMQRSGLPLLLHDAACPLVPAAFLGSAIAACPADGALVAVRPVTDTIKRLDGDIVGQTLDREGLLTVTAPVVLSASVVAALERWPEVADLPALVRALRDRFPVRFLEAPSIGRRVEDFSAVLALEAFEELDPA